jgi:hypothetical protein
LWFSHFLLWFWNSLLFIKSAVLKRKQICSGWPPWEPGVQSRGRQARTQLSPVSTQSLFLCAGVFREHFYFGQILIIHPFPLQICTKLHPLCDRRCYARTCQVIKKHTANFLSWSCWSLLPSAQSRENQRPCKVTLAK